MAFNGQLSTNRFFRRSFLAYRTFSYGWPSNPVYKVSESTHEVMVVYGTSQKTERLYPTEFVIKDSDSGFAVSGLAHDTKFDMAVTIELPYDSDWFDLAPIKSGVVTTSPVMGTLHTMYVSAAGQALKNVSNAA